MAAAAVPACGLVRARIARIEVDAGRVRCTLDSSVSATFPAYIGKFIGSGFSIECAAGVSDPGQALFTQPQTRGECLFGRIAHANQPKEDRKAESFVRCQLEDDALGVASLMLSNDAIREYFYGPLYRNLGADAEASPAELRLAFRLAALEGRNRRVAERAFNILSQPELRAAYDSTQANADRPLPFPYGGAGSLLVAGDRSRDGDTFFACRILAFRADRRDRTFRASFRRIEFFDKYAVYKDARRKAEVILDPAILPLSWDATWNQWKHLAGLKIGIQGTFVGSPKARFQNGEWHSVTWESALPSRLKVTLPANAVEIIAKAQQTYRRLGAYFDVLV